ncbi:MAG: Type I restriction-modification system, restriction subunit R (EC [uncultured Thiotrichaceae bacterium]|uniref:Type I restriction enzyme endonuclease subunit n=1 Tax=uncultured Thiotrichaceae bacterium TaxID=298394 RepID=A0A6S6U9Z3_9GAMM|nr:MAG: Type I restriction-modification system, restriction subunit R (EC [uncultured Thiotrichaceae bacterium]
MTFTSEAQFEAALIESLVTNKGWETEVLKSPTEADLLRNWADILYQNNNTQDRLNDAPLTDTEMQQIVEQIRELKTPLKLNGFINGKTVAITRDNPEDKAHLGIEISLHIYDRHEIAKGTSRYQIVQQPRFAKTSKIQHDRRGDVMLLINGMPVIHIELKRSKVPVSKAYGQIETYSREGVFTGLFALVQVFVAMNPDETVYFANPGMAGRFNKDYYFHWADFDNEPVNDWRSIASRLLSIPMAHQLIGFYTVADDTDEVLKVMRSYQYYAANAISDKVAKTNWTAKERLGGYIWHTTGSGKTMTSFKSAQLIAQSKDADKVVFLMDRVELGMQSLTEYQGFADDKGDVQETTSTHELITKLKSTDPAKILIVSSIQKMSNISEAVNDEGISLQSHDIALINDKRLVFIVDEAHRSTFGDMLTTIKQTFPAAVFFGFTGTPIQDENQKKKSTTSTIFGDELHRYSIADGIRDKNVLGFDPYKVLTFEDMDVRLKVALHKAKAETENDALADPKKKKVFNRYMRDVNMAGHKKVDGEYVKGIEDEIPTSEYQGEEHQKMVVKDILKRWTYLSQNSKFHAIFATSSIPESIQYYRRIKQAAPTLKISALFDPHIDEGSEPADSAFKQAGLIEVLEDYNAQYGQDFSLANHAQFKKNIAARLAHKKPYLYINSTPEQQIDLLIVVDQMLTGFDSKWLNTLYLDKVLKYENIIQAFSRTNRLYIESEKPFGTIRYYRYPHTMQRNIEDAVKLYSGDTPTGLFVDKLEKNLNTMNRLFEEVGELFAHAGEANFEKLPADSAVCGQFAKLFKDFNEHLEAAKIQGFTWGELCYPFDDEKGQRTLTLLFDENTYLTLVLRYRELSSDSEGGSGRSDDVPFDLSGHLTEIDTGKIDADYMNSRFEKYLKTAGQNDSDSDLLKQTLNELHKSFATLSQEEQKVANQFLNDVQRGDVIPKAGKMFRQYISEYQANAKQAQITTLINLLGKEDSSQVEAFNRQLNKLMNVEMTEANINEFGRFDALKNCVDKAKAKSYFEALEGESISVFKVNVKVDKLLQKFVLSGGCDL